MDSEFTALLKRISHAGKNEIDAVFSAAYNRYRELNPDWDIIYISSPKGGTAGRQEEIDTLIEFLQKYG